MNESENNFKMIETRRNIDLSEYRRQASSYMARFGGHCGAKNYRDHIAVLCGDGCVKRKTIFECLVLRVFSAIILK